MNLTVSLLDYEYDILANKMNGLIDKKNKLLKGDISNEALSKTSDLQKKLKK